MYMLIWINCLNEDLEEEKMLLSVTNSSFIGLNISKHVWKCGLLVLRGE